MSDFGSWLKSELQQRGETGSSFAKRLGVGPGTVNRWASGLRTPDYRSSQLIAEALGLPERLVLAEAGHLPHEDAERERLLADLEHAENRIYEIKEEINTLKLELPHWKGRVREIREDLDELDEMTATDDPVFEKLLFQLGDLFPSLSLQEEARRRIHRAVKALRKEGLVVDDGQ